MKILIIIKFLFTFKIYYNLIDILFYENILFQLGLIMIGFSVLIILLPEYHSIKEISDNNTLLKINSCNEMHSLDDDSKQSSNFINWSFNCDLSGISLRNYDLSGANLEGVNLSGSDLTGSNMIKVNMKNAILYGSDLREANLLEFADLTNTILDGFQFT